MEPLTYITGAFAIAVTSGAIGRMLGNNKRVKEDTCKERREACLALVVEKIDHLEELIKNIGKID